MAMFLVLALLFPSLNYNTYNKITFFHFRLPHHKRPPNLLSPGVFNFRTHTSANYYFHHQVRQSLLLSYNISAIFIETAKGYP